MKGSMKGSTREFFVKKKGEEFLIKKRNEIQSWIFIYFYF